MKVHKSGIRRLSLFMTLVMITGCMAACGSGSTSTGIADESKSTASNAASTSQRAGTGSKDSLEALKYDKTGESYTRGKDGYPQLKGITLSIWMNVDERLVNIGCNNADLDTVKKLCKSDNVNLTFQHPPKGHEKENFMIMIASNNLPDMIMSDGVDQFYPGGIYKAYDDKLLYEYTELVNDKNTPLFMKKVISDEFLAKNARDDTKRIIRLGSSVGGSKEACAAMFGMFIRKDMLKATGLEAPVTIDDWYVMLKAMKKNGVPYPLILDNRAYFANRNAFSAAYGIPAAAKDECNFYIKEEGKIGYGTYENAYRDYLSTLQKWYKEGLINPDFMNQDHHESWSMIANDKGGATAQHFYTYGDDYYATREKNDPNAAMMAADLPVLKKGDKIRLMVGGRSLGVHKYITADTKYPLACVLFMDSLYNDDVNFMFNNGFEGRGYTLNDKGYPVLTQINKDTDKNTVLGTETYHFVTACDQNLDEILTSKYPYGCQPDCLKLMVKHSSEGRIPASLAFTSEESKYISAHYTDIRTYEQEYMLKAITGKEDLANFETYREGLKKLGIEEMIKIYQASFERYKLR